MTSTPLPTVSKEAFEERFAPLKIKDPLSKKHKRSKKVERELPGLTEDEKEILQSVKSRAHYVDKSFKLGGLIPMRWAFFIGSIPCAGDAIQVAMSYLLVVRKAREADIPDWLFRKMRWKLFISACVGLVPLFGDSILAMYKVNWRHAALLEEYLRMRGEQRIDMEARQAASRPSTRAASQVHRWDGPMGQIFYD